jgi:hypothetical protein
MTILEEIAVTHEEMESGKFVASEMIAMKLREKDILKLHVIKRDGKTSIEYGIVTKVTQRNDDEEIGADVKFELVNCDVKEEHDKRIAELESRLRLLKEHNYIDARPDGKYALRILQSYRNMCNVSWSDVINEPPTNPLCIEMNKINEMRKTELDIAIEKLSR